MTNLGCGRRRCHIPKGHPRSTPRPLPFLPSGPCPSFLQVQKPSPHGACLPFSTWPSSVQGKPPASAVALDQRFLGHPGPLPVPPMLARAPHGGSSFRVIPSKTLAFSRLLPMCQVHRCAHLLPPASHHCLPVPVAQPDASLPKSLKPPRDTLHVRTAAPGRHLPPGCCLSTPEAWILFPRVGSTQPCEELENLLLSFFMEISRLLCRRAAVKGDDAEPQDIKPGGAQPSSHT